MRRRPVALALAVAALVAAACSDDGGTAARPATTSVATTVAAGTPTTAAVTGAVSSTTAAPTTVAPTTTAAPAVATAANVRATKIALAPVATATAPLVLVPRPGTTNLYVAERAGRVRVLAAGGALGAPIIDISADVTTDFEKGLLGLAFSPDATLLYLSYTDRDSNTRIDEFRMNGDAPDMGTRRIVLQIDQPAGNHNGGNIAFGPDGYLWIGMGDGGGSGDQFRNGQNVEALLGSMLRIDPSGRAAGGYSVPADNPFVAGGGRPEIWMKGLRNPWRWSFDRATGDLWIGDVGQNLYEEVDVLRAPGRGKGANLQWPLREGLHKFRGDAPEGSTPPIFEYDRSNGACSVIGGFVYRGSALAGLQGAYVYGDYCEAQLYALVPKGDGVEPIDLGVNAGKGTLVSFGQDAAGELYALSISGAITKLVPA